MSKQNELALNSTSQLAMTGNALGSEFGHQDYGTIQLTGVRLVDEAWLLNLITKRDELLAALEQIANSNPDSTVRGLQQAAAAATFDTKTTGPSIAELQNAGELVVGKPLDAGAASAIDSLVGSVEFTSVSKGGTYKRLGAIRGAGQIKGLAGIAYRDEKTGALFVRTPECFAARMKQVEGGAQ